jgi:hypothetical protein
MTRFRLSSLLWLTLVVALTLGLFVAIRRNLALRSELDELRDKQFSAIHTAQYGYANLDLLRVHPDIWTDKTCGRYFQHELAVSLHWHWLQKDEIDNLLPYPDGSMVFAKQAVRWLEVQNLDEFIAKANALCIYPDDELSFIDYELRPEQRVSFDAFIREAAQDDG